MKYIKGFFEKLEETIKIYLSHRPRLYALIVGIGIVFAYIIKTILPLSSLVGLISKITADILIIQESIMQIAESKRLSEILIIEGKKDLGIKPEDFEPKKEELRKTAHVAIEKSKHPTPSTWAYCILKDSGLELFLDSKSRGNAEKVLGRLLANGNMQAVKGFLTKLVNAL